MNPTTIIFDGHNDTLLELYLAKDKYSFFDRNTKGHLDLPRMREGGFGGGIFAIFVPHESELKNFIPLSELANKTGEHIELKLDSIDHLYAQKVTIALAALLFRLEAESNGQMKVVRNINELTECLNQGIISAVLHFEGAEAIDTDLNALYVFHQAGLRSLGIVWSRPNAFAYGVPFKFPHSPDTGPGLTDAGKELVRTCNKLGIMIDLSHINEKGFWDVAKISTAPLVATHSAVHSICPSTRNLTDKQIDAIGESNGVIGLNFSVGDLRTDGKRDANTPIEQMIQHINYIVDRIGIDHIAFGSDFDGTTISNEIGNVTGLPKLIDKLKQSGYDNSSLRKITYENWIRVLGKTWKENNSSLV